MKTTTTWKGKRRFEAVGMSGETTVMDVPPANGGEGRGAKPMELVLMGLAGCAGYDIAHIMEKKRESLTSLVIEVDGDRAETTPQRYTAIRVDFIGEGAAQADSLEKAAALSMEKYCSVSASLNAAIGYAVTWNGVRTPAAGYRTK